MCAGAGPCAPALTPALELEHKVSWEVVAVDPPADFTSRVDTIHLRRVSEVRHLAAPWAAAQPVRR